MGHSHPQAEDSSAQVFNEDELLERLMGDRDLASAVVDGFLEDTPKQIQAIESHLIEGHAAHAGSVAHGIKGAASMVSGVALAKAASAMEQAGKAGDLFAASNCLPALKGQFDTLRTAMMSMANMKQ